ncbi:MAG: DNA alkylation repair protein [Planctomycetaceae bacterium]|jgi:3-methyladenine DNA glycosylase AlkD|nr:DNA alkylation repair protein [Planctomycetaceae bacterium]
MADIIRQIRQTLKSLADEKVRQSGQRFFKEAVKMYGVKTPVVRRIAKEFFVSLKDKSKTEIFTLCEKLWQSGVIEEAFAACEWTARKHKALEVDDFPLLERWITQYITNWAACDTFCNHTVGTFVEMYPKYVKELKRWAKSDNLWQRRAAAVSLIIPARKGLFQQDIFAIAKILLTDSEDMVQKGYGWMLKAAADFDTPSVFNFVMDNKNTMPRTALRYAVEKMPPALKIKAMQR